MRAVLAVVVFGLIEGVRWLRTRQLPGDTAGKYQQQAAAFRDPLTEPENHWYWSGLSPFPPPGDVSGDEGQSKNWERTIARAQFLGGASHDATWLLWGIIAGQLIMALPDQPRRRRAALSQRVSLRLPGERAPDGTHPGTPSASGVAGEFVVELTVNMDHAGGAVQVPAAEKGNQIDYQTRVREDGDTVGE